MVESAKVIVSNDASDYLLMAFAVLLGTAEVKAMNLAPTFTHARVKDACMHPAPDHYECACLPGVELARGACASGSVSSLHGLLVSRGTGVS